MDVHTEVTEELADAAAQALSAYVPPTSREPPAILAECSA